MIAYSTSSDGTVVDNRPLTVIVDEAYDMTPEPHCFVCGRHTDHMGEHDSLVAIGLASYDWDDWSVSYTPFARTPEGEKVRDWYDAAIDRAMRTRGVDLVKPEGHAATQAFLAGINLPVGS